MLKSDFRYNYYGHAIVYKNVIIPVKSIENTVGTN